MENKLISVSIICIISILALASIVMASSGSDGKIYDLYEITDASVGQTFMLRRADAIRFDFKGDEFKCATEQVVAEYATLKLWSSANGYLEQFSLQDGQKRPFDFDNDGKTDFSLKLINITITSTMKRIYIEVTTSIQEDSAPATKVEPEKTPADKPKTSDAQVVENENNPADAAGDESTNDVVDETDYSNDYIETDEPDKNTPIQPEKEPISSTIFNLLMWFVIIIILIVVVATFAVINKKTE
jgi:uncharacterized integral membrane protein